MVRREEVGPEGLPCVRFDSVKDGMVWAVWEHNKLVVYIVLY